MERKKTNLTRTQVRVKTDATKCQSHSRKQALNNAAQVQTQEKNQIFATTPSQSSAYKGKPANHHNLWSLGFKVCGRNKKRNPLRTQVRGKTDASSIFQGQNHSRT